MDMGDSRVNPNAQAHEPFVYCNEGRRLLDAFGETVHAVVLLHEQQFQAIVEGDAAANRFDLLIHDANERKQNAKYAFMSHLEQHGCS